MDVNVPDVGADAGADFDADGRPKHVRYVGLDSVWLAKGKVYDVLEWDSYGPRIMTEDGRLTVLADRYWEPVVRSASRPEPLPQDVPPWLAGPIEPKPRKEVDGTVAHSILTEAAKIVVGARHTTHGEKERSFAVIASFWNAYIQGRKAPNDPLSPRDVAQLMTLLKIGRSIQGTAVRDHFVDACGYAAIAGELE